MADKYGSFSELAHGETEELDYRVRLQECRGSIVLIAPHGGGIEPGTSETAEAIARDDLSFYAFEGIKSTSNKDLHITSTRFDEPKGVALVTASPIAISIHGEESERRVVFVGGRDEAMMNRLRESLNGAGFKMGTHESVTMQGREQTNICNRSQTGRGVQLELSRGLRRLFFESLSRTGRQHKTERFYLFVDTVRCAIT